MLLCLNNVYIRYMCLWVHKFTFVFSYIPIYVIGVYIVGCGYTQMYIQKGFLHLFFFPFLSFLFFFFLFLFLLFCLSWRPSVCAKESLDFEQWVIYSFWHQISTGWNVKDGGEMCWDQGRGRNWNGIGKLEESWDELGKGDKKSKKWKQRKFL